MARRVITNNVPREVIDGSQLNPVERAEFDYLDWSAIDEGRDSASFFRYRGQLHYLGNFMATDGMSPWQGVEADSFFSATVIRYAGPDGEYVIVGRVLS